MTVLEGNARVDWSAVTLPIWILGALLLFDGLGWIALDTEVLLALVYCLSAAAVALAIVGAAYLVLAAREVRI